MDPVHRPRRPGGPPHHVVPQWREPGFNHICFAVSDIDDMIAKVTAAGVNLRNQPMIFHDRKVVFLEGPDGITVELAEWQ